MDIESSWIAVSMSHMQKAGFLIARLICNLILRTWQNSVRSEGYKFAYTSSRAGSHPAGDARKKISIIENPIKVFLHWYMYVWFDCHLPGAVVSQGISRPNAENCSGFSPPLDSRRLRSRIA